MKSPIPYMSLRGLPLFPNGRLSLAIGRPFTLQSIKDALEFHDGVIAVSAQKAIELNDQPELTQVFSVGCLCKIEQHVEFPDGSMKVLIVPGSRFQIESLEDQDGARFCTGRAIPNFAQDEEIPLTRRQPIHDALQTLLSGQMNERTSRVLDRLVSKDDSYAFVMDAGHLLSLTTTPEKQLSLEQINQGIFEIDTYTSEERGAVNVSTMRVQEILEASDAQTALRKIEALLL